MRSLLVSFLAIFALASISAHAATTSRVFAAAQSFSINGVDCPEVQSWSGGDISGTIVEIVENSAVTRKHIGQVGYEPILVKATPPLSTALSACLADLCAGRSAGHHPRAGGDQPEARERAARRSDRG